MDEIGRSDVIALCEGVVAKGSPIQANRVQALISKIFAFALDAELVSANPCARLKKRSKETRATRVLSDDEIRLFWRHIGESPNSARIGQAMRLVLLTGVRVQRADRCGNQGIRASRRRRERDLDHSDGALEEWPRACRAVSRVGASDRRRPHRACQWVGERRGDRAPAPRVADRSKALDRWARVVGCDDSIWKWLA